MELVHQNLGVYPLWLCPLKPDDKSPLQSNNIQTPLVINVGVWGNKSANREAFLHANRLIETWLGQLGGKKWFYAHAYYTAKEFWSRYDKNWYDGLRAKYHALSLPSIYDKVHVTDVHDIHLKRGALRTLIGQAKIRISK
jgi:delta24-sterol reductase